MELGHFHVIPTLGASGGFLGLVFGYFLSSCGFLVISVHTSRLCVQYQDERQHLFSVLHFCITFSIFRVYTRSLFEIHSRPYLISDGRQQLLGDHTKASLLGSLGKKLTTCSPPTWHWYCITLPTLASASSSSSSPSQSQPPRVSLVSALASPPNVWVCE